MGWCRQCCALMRKNRIIKCRMCGSTLAEILLPVLVMLIMVGLRAAVSTDDNPASLHTRPVIDPEEAAAARVMARASGRLVLGEFPYDMDYGSSWNGSDVAKFMRDQPARRNAGTGGVQQIHFVGDLAPTSVTSRCMDAFKAAYPELQAQTFHRFADDDDLEDYVSGSSYATSVANSAIYTAIVFRQTGQNNVYNYAIRGNATFSLDSSTSLMTAENTVNTLQTKFEPDAHAVLLTRGHILLQDFVEKWIIQEATGKTVTRSLSFQPFPTPPYVEDGFADTVSSVLGLFFTIIYIWPVTRLVKGIVEEKQLRIKEGMRMMGLPDSALFCSWIGTYTLLFLLTSIGITIVTSGSVYEHSNKAYVFFFFFLFAMSTFSFCWLLSVFFSRAQVATTFAALFFLAFFFPYFAVSGVSTSTSSKAAACLASQVCFGLGAVVMAKLESQSGGVQAHNVNTMVDGWSYNATIGMFIADFFIYLLLALYFQQIVPSEWGTHRKWYFCVQRSFWCTKKINTTSRAAAGHKGAEATNGAGFDAALAAVPHQQLPESEGLVSGSNGEQGYGAASPSGSAGRHDKSYYFEPVSEAIKQDVGVSMRGLRKVFHTDGDADDFVAVKGIDLDLYQGQILALLGHNGAGKTTTINMMTGMIEPTSGDALIYGTSIKDNMQAVRNILGVVPQHDILFDLLTVKEHLELFAAIKDVPKEETEAAIDEMISQVGLTEKVNDKSAALSGGMKRKLSVGIALLGDSKIVFLDEPTSGMDPYSRRATWDLLKKKKEGRVIILTTHFMDEADQLGDRIAIMAKGDVKCCGSSLFLKSRYGVGYTLTITKGEGFDEAAVSSLLDASIPGVTPLSNIAAEISFRLPFQSSAHFADVFDQFDGQQARLGITGYGISVTTLEEVFLRVGHEDDADPAAVLEQRRMLKDAQDQISRSSLEPVSSPIDAADAPVRSPELVVIGEGSEYKDGHAVAQPSSGRGGGLGGAINTISVRPNSSSRAQADAHPNGEGKDKAKKLSRSSSSRFSSLRIPGADEPMFLRHFRALFTKRWLNAKRDRKVWTWTLLYPFLILLIGIGLIKLTQRSTFPNLPIRASELEADTRNEVPWASNSAVASTPVVFASAPTDSTNFYTDATPALANLGGTGANFTQFNTYLLDGVYPTVRQAGSRYTAFQTSVTNDATSINDDLVVYYNTSAQWSSVLGLNIYNNQLLSALGSSVRIVSNIHPLPQTLNMQTLLNSLVAVIVAIGFAFMPANFIAYAVKEEQDKVKHQQLISGVSAASYWAANYAWDFINYMVMGLFCLLIFRIWSIDELIGENTGGVFLAIVLYGLAVIPFNYLFSFFFTESTSAQNSMLLFYIFAGALLLIATIVLSILESTKDIAYHIKFVCRLIPSYCFGECIANIIIRESATAFGGAKDLMSMEVVGYPMIFMTWEIFAYTLIVLGWEKIRATPSLSAMVFGNPEVKAANAPDEDEDVIAEKARLQSGGGGADDAIKIMGLRKVYKGRLGGGNKIAVQDLWMGVPKGQCLGFLGINGAGKTTTLKMLTGDIIPGSGTATLNNLDILTHQNDVRRLLGYCPQFDALIDTLTAREHLVLFARIKGVPEEIMAEYVEHLILRLGLQEGIADKPTKGYSGGNKRKLCVGIALIGNPPIVFLDEPSTGMDPGSRRFMWDLIASTMKNRSVILTTHSMEECEALCARTGIMVGGRLRCLGSTTRLKNVYGNGYQLDVNVASGPLQDAFKAELSSNWADVQIIEQHGDSLKFRLPRQSADGRRTTIGQVFRLIEEVKEKFYIKDYSVSETTLEQIFIHFAKQQEEETGHVAGL